MIKSFSSLSFYFSHKSYSLSYNILLNTYIYRMFCNISKKNNSFLCFSYQKDFLNNFAYSFNINNEYDWINIKRKDICNNGGSKLFIYYNSLPEALQTIYPNKQWNIIYLSSYKLPKNYWKSKQSIIYYINYLKSLNIQNDLRTLTKQNINELGGKQVLYYYKSIDNIINIINNKSLYSLEYGKRNLQLLEKYLMISNINQWNTISLCILKKLPIKCLSILIECEYNLSNILSFIYPQYSWNNVYLNQQKPSSFWNNKDNHKDYILHLSKILKKDIHKITIENIKDYGGIELLCLYLNIQDIIRSLFPSNTLELKKPKFYWKSKENQQKFLLDLTVKLGYSSPLQLKGKDILENGGKGLLRYCNSFHNLICYHFPNENIDYKNIYFPNNYWKEPKNQLLFMEYIKNKYNIQCFNDWRNITRKQIENEGGSRLFEYYHSIFNILSSLYPHYEWNILKHRKRVTRYYWENKENHRKFFDYLAQKLHINNPKQWNNINVSTIKAQGGIAVLSYYKSFYEALKINYPEINWNIYERTSLPQYYWDNIDNIKDFLNKLKKEYSINDDNDWYRISREQIIRMKGGRLLQKYGNLYSILSLIYPNKQWNKEQFQIINKKSNQRELLLKVKELLNTKDNNLEIIEDFEYSNIIRDSNHLLQFDIWIPKYKLVFEYQGEHHYKETPFFGQIELYQQRDNEKQILCKNNNITLINIPYWYNNTTNELKEFIKKQTNNDEILKLLS